MSDPVHASPTDIRKLAVSLDGFKQDVTNAAKRVQGALAQANWHDARKAQFETSFQDLQRKVDSFMTAEVDEMSKRLNQLASRLEEIRDVRM